MRPLQGIREGSHELAKKGPSIASQHEAHTPQHYWRAIPKPQKMRNPIKPKAMLASLASAIGNISERFCCNPYTLIYDHKYYAFDEGSSCSSDTHCGVDEGKHYLHSPASHLPSEILVPTHASLYHTSPAYHQARNFDIIVEPPHRQVARNSDMIIEPPPLTRFPHIIDEVSPTFEKATNAYAFERDQECIYLCE